MKILQHSQVHEDVWWEHEFRYAEDPTAGFGFECDENGNLLPSVRGFARKNYQICKSGELDGETLVYIGIKEHHHLWREPAVGECVCGQPVTLEGFTCACDYCGRDYNASGQLLASREQWGEETGEHPADIARIP